MKTMMLALLTSTHLLLTAVGPNDAVTGERVLVDFSLPSAEAWRSVNDNVMGGRSSGSSEIIDGQLVFSGATRLENNGGFASVRSQGTSWNLEDADALQIRVQGTSARKYTMLLETSQRYWGMQVSYWCAFELNGDGWQELRLPLADFEPVFRGRKLSGRELDRSDIRSMGVMVYDKKAGPFRLAIDEVKAISKASDAALVAVDEATPAKPNIVELAQGTDQFKSLVTAAVEAGLVETLTSTGPFTVLAPTDEAFAALPEGTLASLLEPKNIDQLKSILLYHVIPGRLSSSQLLSAKSLPSVQGQEIAFSIAAGRLKAGEANILLNDLEASNGMVHAIDRVLLPKPEASPEQRLIEVAVAKGSELFNAGEAKACAAVYEVTVTALLDLAATSFSPEVRKILADALSSAQANEDQRKAAWTLRNAMNAAWTSLAK